MAAMIKKECKNCESPMEVRKADHDRGWGKFCSKRCKATHQVKRGGKYTNYQKIGRRRDPNAKEFGGIPVYNRNGEYEGFVRTSIEPWDDHK